MSAPVNVDPIYGLMESIRTNVRGKRRWEKIDSLTDAVLLVAQVVYEHHRTWAAKNRIPTGRS